MRYLLIKSKKDGTPLLSVAENQQYRLPAGYTITDVTIEVWQEKPVISFTPETRACSRCQAPAFWKPSCCAERAAGFRGKWMCSVCRFVSYTR